MEGWRAVLAVWGSGSDSSDLESVSVSLSESDVSTPADLRSESAGSASPGCCDALRMPCDEALFAYGGKGPKQGYEWGRSDEAIVENP